MTVGDESLRRLVSLRAAGKCEYCRLPLEFDDSPACLDHIVAIKHHGRTIADNLAYACFHDNNYKGDNLAGIDPVDGSLTRLFNPRVHTWSEHFEFQTG